MAGSKRRGIMIPLVIGSILVLAGVLLAAPRWSLNARGTVVDAYVIDVLSKPQADGNVQLVVVFEYEIKGHGAGVSKALGYGEIDLNGRLSDGPIVDVETARSERKRLLPPDGRRRPLRPAVYDADAPFESARLLSEKSDDWGFLGGTSLRFNLGILLILTPFCLAFSSLLTRVIHALIARSPKRERQLAGQQKKRTDASEDR